MNAGTFFDGFYTAPVNFLVSRWFAIGHEGFYTVCGGCDGFVDYAMRAVVDDFGNLVRVS